MGVRSWVGSLRFILVVCTKDFYNTKTLFDTKSQLIGKDWERLRADVEGGDRGWDVGWHQ